MKRYLSQLRTEVSERTRGFVMQFPSSLISLEHLWITTSKMAAGSDISLFTVACHGAHVFTAQTVLGFPILSENLTLR